MLQAKVLLYLSILCLSLFAMKKFCPLNIRVNIQVGASRNGQGWVVAVGDQAGSPLEVGQVVGGDAGVAHLVQLFVGDAALANAGLQLSKKH